MGIVGSAMILLLFLYSVRKRRTPGFRWGRLSRWLDIHIFLGTVGPLLITLHTAMKFHGVVTISYVSMVTVMLSGVFGRYVYMQIPRDTKGDVLTLEQIRSRMDEIDQKLRDEFGLPEDVRERAASIMRSGDLERAGVLSAFARTLVDDLFLLARVRRLRRYMRKRRLKIKGQIVAEILRMSRERSVLARRVALLSGMKRLFYYWHVFHKPFAYIMIAIMFLHIVVTVSFGYRWIF